MQAASLLKTLSQVKRRAPPSENLLVGYDNADDASVYKISPDVAIVNTTDFFPPIVDSPYDYGRIVAANSLSDIYAMGARPITALSLVGFPTSKLPNTVLQAMLQGCEDKAAEAGCAIAGGHTIDIGEPIFGLAVTGVVHPERILQNGPARPGDALLLTKPLGTGLVTTMLKKDFITRDSPGVAAVIASMYTLNRAASEVFAARAEDVHSLTDVTGFGLAGHLKETLASSDPLVARLFADKLPVFEAAMDILERSGSAGVPGGAISNAVYAGDSDEPLAEDQVSLRWLCGRDVPERLKAIVVDPQTSGGLLAAVPWDKHEDLLAALKAAGVDATLVGRTHAPEECGLPSFARCIAVTASTQPADVLRDAGRAASAFEFSQFVLKGLPPAGKAAPAPARGVGAVPGGAAQRKVIYITRPYLGGDNTVLGRKLLLAHVAKLAHRPTEAVFRLVFMNEAVRIPAGLEDKRYLAPLRKLEEAGIDVSTCGTCLDHFALTADMLEVGRTMTAEESLDLLTDPLTAVVTLS
eukprot:gnl/Chilomastix_cuspidata/64.p1 GENE.gnl/Chilomastix_cuspidata/64~~gnl/Chilomastix_cuspidata/64.p1  ORF type:complete len:585 (-),score=233.76 gnl/Chilomastix_cuspidata/64:817-2391(-)